jgi:hypothetical protein
MFIPFQLISLIHSVNINYTTPYSHFHIFSILNANPIYFMKNANNIYNLQKVIPFNQENYDFSLKLIIGLNLSLFCIFIILNMLKYCDRKKTLPRDKQTLDKRGRIISLFYKHFIFPVTIGFFIPVMLFLSSHEIK